MASTDILAGHKIFYVRHSLSLSNAKDNSGVHLLDPTLTTSEIEEEWLNSAKLDLGKAGTGRQYVQTVLRDRLKTCELQSYVFIVSPLARTIHTFLLSAPEEGLRNGLIILEPLLIKQTRWLSDRPGSIDYTTRIIREELQQRHFSKPIALEDLNIDWSRMNGDRDDTGKFVPFPDPEPLHISWRVKTGLWHSKSLLIRGRCALEAILEECRKAAKGGIGGDMAVIVFGHGGFVNYMAQEVGDINVAMVPPRLSVWSTGESREYLIHDRPSRGPAQLMVETKESRARRLGHHTQSEIEDAQMEEKRRESLWQYVCDMEYWSGHSKEEYDEADETGRNP